MCIDTSDHNLALPAGEPKLRSNQVAPELSKEWAAMDREMQAAATDPLMEELRAHREEVETRPKITPVHVLKDVTATIAKLTKEVIRQWTSVDVNSPVDI